jgi:hypothetical protein
MRIRRITGIIVLSLMTAFFLAACGGGGGGDSAPDLTPLATTVPANSITSNSAVLNAIVNPKGLATTAWFEYSKDPALVSNVTTTTPQVMGSGSTDNTISQIITGLESGQTYSFRVTATNSAGTKKGAIFTISTLPLPTVTTNPATSITTTGATLNAVVNPNGRGTYAWFEYGETASLGTTIDNADRGSGTTNVSVSSTLTGLKVATKYSFRLVAASSAGTAYGTTLDFTTAGGVPLVTTKSAISVTTTGGVLRADVNPSGLATNAWFEYGTDNTFSTIATTDNQAIPAGTSAVGITATISGRTLGETIYYRVVASNIVGPSLKGEAFSFTTLNPPPTANAGTDQSVYTRSATGATVVYLDATGSSTDPSKQITSYAWTQLSGTTVTLDSLTLDTPEFTAPQFAYGPSQDLVFGVTVTDNTGLSATDNVTVTVNWGFLDDFNTDTTATYTVSGTGALSYDAGNKMAKVITGTGIWNQISHLFNFGVGNTTDEGVFSMDLWPTTIRTGAGIAIAIGDSANTYIRISTLSGEDIVEKYRAGVLIDSLPFTANPTAGKNNPIKITFNRTVTTVEAFGQTVTMVGADNRIPMAYFSVTATGMDALYDNFKLEIHP